MFTIPQGTASAVAEILEGLFRAHPVGRFGGSGARGAERQAHDALARMAPHLRDDLGLPPVAPDEPEHPALARARRKASRNGS